MIKNSSMRRLIVFRSVVLAPRRKRQHLCGDKGYDADILRREAKRRRYTPHIKSRGEEQTEKRQRGRRARRWVVERIASWINRFRRLLVR